MQNRKNYPACACQIVTSHCYQTVKVENLHFRFRSPAGYMCVVTAFVLTREGTNSRSIVIEIYFGLEICSDKAF